MRAVSTGGTPTGSSGSAKIFRAMIPKSRIQRLPIAGNHSGEHAQVFGVLAFGGTCAVSKSVPASSLCSSNTVRFPVLIYIMFVRHIIHRYDDNIYDQICLDSIIIRHSVVLDSNLEIRRGIDFVPICELRSLLLPDSYDEVLCAGNITEAVVLRYVPRIPPTKRERRKILTTGLTGRQHFVIIW
jgi:hypothetical protein